MLIPTEAFGASHVVHGTFDRDETLQRSTPPMSEIEKSPARARSGAFSLGGDRRVGACASGDELVSLGFRVGNPSAIGWHQRRIFQHPCYP